MTKRRVILDTNVLISAALRENSLPREVMWQALHVHEALASQETIREIQCKLFSARFDAYIPFDSRVTFLEWYTRETRQLTITSNVEICRDPNDNMFLALALDGKADVIVTGDGDLLALHPFRGTAILSPAEALPMLVET